MASLATLLLAACSSSGGIGGVPGGGGTQAVTMNLTVSGGLDGTTKQVVTAHCPNLAATKLVPYTVRIDTTLGGKPFQVLLMINRYQGPLTIQLPGKDPARVTINLTGSAADGSWHRGPQTQGTVTVNADQTSGTVDVKGLEGSNKSGKTKNLDLSLTYSCPTGK